MKKVIVLVSVLSLMFGCSKKKADPAPVVTTTTTNNNNTTTTTPSGTVTTLAGGTSGTSDGQGSLASFNESNDLIVDPSGNVYVTDSKNHTIRKITPDGLVSTFAGSGLKGTDDGQGTQASFYTPNGIDIDASGNIFVADFSNNVVRKITPSGYVSVFAGSLSVGNSDGQGVLATFHAVSDVAVDA